MWHKTSYEMSGPRVVEKVMERRERRWSLPAAGQEMRNRKEVGGRTEGD